MSFSLPFFLIILAAVVACLSIWRDRIKNRPEAHDTADRAEHALSGMRLNAWLLIGLIVPASIAQAQLLGLFTSIRDDLALLVAPANNPGIKIDEVKNMLRDLQTDVTLKIDGAQMSARRDRQRLSGISIPPRALTGVENSGSVGAFALPKVARVEADFARAAQASALGSVKSLQSDAPRSPRARAGAKEKESPPPPGGWSMPLNLVGLVRADTLIVRQQPSTAAPVVERLVSGQEIKVTEKRIIDKQMWYCVITPSGRSGWVDFRYVRLKT